MCLVDLFSLAANVECAERAQGSFAHHVCPGCLSVPTFPHHFDAMSDEQERGIQNFIQSPHDLNQSVLDIHHPSYHTYEDDWSHDLLSGHPQRIREQCK